MTPDLDDFRGGRDQIRAAYAEGRIPYDSAVASLVGHFADAVDYIDQLIAERDEARSMVEAARDCCGCTGTYDEEFLPWEEKPNGD